MTDVRGFLERFHLSKQIDEVFTSGCCYWFAHILFYRFIRDGSQMMYAPVDNHFGTKIKGRVYDITGDVTEQYEWIPWLEFSDEIERDRIVRDCILFQE